MSGRLIADAMEMHRGTDLVDAEPALKAYVARCEERPAFRKALADQMAPFAVVHAP